MRRRQGLKRTVIGAVMAFLLAPLVFVLALWLGVRWTVDAVDNAQRLDPGQAVSLKAGEKVTLFVFQGTTSAGDGADSNGTDTPAVTCSATGPDGQPANLQASTGTSVTNGGERWQQSYELTAGAAGSYAVSCGDQRVLVLDSGFAGDLAKKLGGAVLAAFVIPFVIGVTGLGLFIWGIVKLSSSKRQAYAPGYAGVPYGQQPYGQAGYGQQQGDGQQPPYGQQQGYRQQPPSEPQPPASDEPPPQDPYRPRS
ncbi:hypothetical protein [Luteipulveratus flavus]|uniref:Uncharacterized protein n=1 Tax=Luteipulveratus flavus TaxID=3031728 RepID=A0ABT6C6Z2_9MICO|nr:hypothetical protein [Luteipulveratus sp. YIM 133296]MDF8264615.1 hypothetical protein [Luteipulveratus sp. YIM 133296]